MLRRASRLYAPPGDCGGSPLTLRPNFNCKKSSVTAGKPPVCPAGGFLLTKIHKTKKPPLKGEAYIPLANAAQNKVDHLHKQHLRKTTSQLQARATTGVGKPQADSEVRANSAGRFRCGCPRKLLPSGKSAGRCGHRSLLFLFCLPDSLIGNTVQLALDKNKPAPTEVPVGAGFAASEQFHLFRYSRFTFSYACSLPRLPLPVQCLPE